MNYIIISIIAVGFLWWLCEKSPYGYEDETGFHYGHPPSDNKKG